LEPRCDKSSPKGQLRFEFEFEFEEATSFAIALAVGGTFISSIKTKTF
jgi:hypothetical protein